MTGFYRLGLSGSFGKHDVLEVAPVHEKYIMISVNDEAAHITKETVQELVNHLTEWLSGLPTESELQP